VADDEIELGGDEVKIGDTHSKLFNQDADVDKISSPPAENSFS
jgi:hypothetical protein